MRSLLKIALSASLPWVIGAGTAVSAYSAGEDGATALLSFEQGQALVDFALQNVRGPGRKPDCSHLVHTIYERAGLKYPYTQSRDLYYGIVEFERVAKPQPGDLIVWLGHVGIVVSPMDRTFFSSVRSGIVTEPWTTDSWKMRGRPRFFRYRIGPDTDQALFAALLTPQTERGDPPGAVPGREYPMPRKTIEKPPAESTSSRLPARSHIATTELESPMVIAVIRQRAKPTKQDVAVALQHSGDARSQKLIAGQLLDLSRPVSIVERMEVRKLQVKNEGGSVTLKMIETIALAGGKIISGKTVERRVNLYRQNDAWIISDPQARFYLPRGHAISVFEQQAELFLQQAPESGDTRTIVKALDVLFDLDPAGAQRAAAK